MINKTLIQIDIKLVIKAQSTQHMLHRTRSALKQLKPWMMWIKNSYFRYSRNGLYRPEQNMLYIFFTRRNQNVKQHW